MSVHLLLSLTDKVYMIYLQVTMNNRVPPLPDHTGDHSGDNNNTILHTGDRQELNNNFTPQPDLDIQVIIIT